jgi:tRNA isopentenyl-2-thiomethyl-A-37 hydroxylase MiaE
MIIELFSNDKCSFNQEKEYCEDRNCKITKGICAFRYRIGMKLSKRFNIPVFVGTRNICVNIVNGRCFEEKINIFTFQNNDVEKFKKVLDFMIINKETNTYTIKIMIVNKDDIEFEH